MQKSNVDGRKNCPFWNRSQHEKKKIIAWSENIEFGFMYDRTIVGGTEFLHGGCTFLIYSMRICSVQKTNKALSSLDANNYGALLQNVLEELINYHAYRR